MTHEFTLFLIQFYLNNNDDRSEKIEDNKLVTVHSNCFNQ